MQHFEWQRPRSGLLGLWLWFWVAFLGACGGGGGETPEAPRITQQPQAVTVPVGASASFSVVATGGEPLRYQWQRNGAAIAGAQAPSYTTPPLLADDNGALYTVQVSNEVGTVTSLPAMLTTSAPVAPVITVQPADVSLVAPASASFSVDATGTAPLSYQWFRDGVALAGATSASFGSGATALADSGAGFSVTVSNAAGSVNSRVAVLTVASTVEPPGIVTPPAAASVTVGQSASFTVVARGSAPLAYQWRRNGVDIVGADSDRYTTPALTLADSSSRYSVAVSNSAGTVVSAEALLTVSSTAVAPSISAQPESVAVLPGAAASFRVTASGSEPLSYQWLRGGLEIAGAVGSSHTTAATTLDDNGVAYRVRVSNAAGSVTSGDALLRVAPLPTITAQPVDATVRVGEQADFVVATQRQAELSFQWQRNGVDIPGADQPGYRTPAVGLADDGARFRLVVSSPTGSVTSAEAVLRVTAAVLPVVTSQPADSSVEAGREAAFVVGFSGGSPYTVQWYRNGLPVSSVTPLLYLTGPTTLANNGDQIRAVARNEAGEVSSRTATLTVTGAPPAIVTPPASTSVVAPASARFSVAAAGTAPLAYQWLRDGSEIAGATGAELVLAATTLADHGARFSVRVGNAAGSVTSAEAVLSVSAAPAADGPPVILAQPQPLAAPPGSVPSFSVRATGRAPLAYQWYRNSVAIDGATAASYSGPAVTAGDAGVSYRAVVSNDLGSAHSDTAELAVTAATAFPERELTIVVPYAAGGPIDRAARDFADALRAEHGWSVVVSNRGGAGGSQGLRDVVTAPADGHTLLFTGVAAATVPILYRSLGIDSDRDLQPLGVLAELPMLLVGRSGLPAGDYGALAGWMGTRPSGSVRLADAGLGSTSHLCGLQLRGRAAVSLGRVPYAGTAPAVTDLLAGQVDVYCDIATRLRPQVQASRVVAYGLTTSERSELPTLAAVPTLNAGGLPGFQASDWLALYAPGATPPEVRARLNAALRRALANATFRSRVLALDAHLGDGPRITPDGHRDFLREEQARWRPLIEVAGEFVD